MKAVRVILVLLAILLVLGAMRGCGVYNKLVKLDEEVTSQWANVENVYQRRMDLIPSLIGTIQGSTDFEKGTLTGVVEARAKATQVTMNANELTPERMEQFQAAQGQLSGALSRLLVTIERYPDLKTTAQFQDMLAELAGTENRISFERQKFNEVSMAYNKYRRRFPQIIFSKIFGFGERAYFKAGEGAEQRYEVNFRDNEAPAATPAPVADPTPATNPEPAEEAVLEVE